MRFVIQRVTESNVKVDGKVIGQIGKGFMVQIGVADSDTKEKPAKFCRSRETVHGRRTLRIYYQ